MRALLRWRRFFLVIIFFLVFLLELQPATAAVWPDITREEGDGRSNVETRLVELSLPDNPSWGLLRGSMYLTVRMTSRSPRPEEIFIELADPAGVVIPGYISLQPGETRTQKLEVRRHNLNAIPEVMLLVFRSAHLQTEVRPDMVEITVQEIPLAEAMAVWVEPYRQILGYLALVVVAAAIFFVAFGALLYRIYVYPVTRLMGSIFYREKKAEEGWVAINGEKRSDAYILWEAKAREVSLKEFEHRFVICIGLPKKVDSPALLLEAKVVPYTIKIFPACRRRRLFFLQGWLALFHGPYKMALLVECDSPGVFETGGAVYTRKIIQPDEYFISGGYCFHFKAPLRKVKDRKEGIDLLLQKGMKI